MFCRNCGKEVSEKAVVCVGCGVGIERADSPIKAKKANPGGIGKWNWLFSLTSIFFTVMAFVFVLLSFEVRSVISGTTISALRVYGYIEISAWAYLLGWLCAGISTALGTVSLVIYLYKKLDDKFNSFLAVTLSAVTIFMLFFLVIVYGI